MNVDTFLTEIANLTGTEIKGVEDADKPRLQQLLENDESVIDCSQFNELLLLVNKDRVCLPFFSYFFNDGCRLGDIPIRVKRFQEAAMLLFGNFVWAYRTLSRISDPADFRRELGDVATDRDEELKRLKDRRPKLLEIEAIDRDETVLLGYLSSVEIVGDQEESVLLGNLLKTIRDGSKKLRSLKTLISRLPDASQRAESERILEAFERIRGTDSVDRFARFLEDFSPEINARVERLKVARAIGERNQDVYLTWDHMDVYFATSMRKPWEFKELHDFIRQIMNAKEILRSDTKLHDKSD